MTVVQITGEEVIEIENPQKDVHDELNLTTDYETFVSLPLNKINIPEVRDIKSDFIYNYYTKNERARIEPNQADKILNLQLDHTDEIYFQSQNDRAPRYIRISFKPPPTYGVLKKASIGQFIEDNLSKILIEGTATNQYFTGIEFSDTAKEKHLYNFLSSSMLFQGIDIDSTSPKDSSQKLYSVLSEKGGLFGDDKRLITEALTNLQSAGYVLAQSDVPADVAARSNDQISKQTFSVQFNNLVMSDIINSSVRINDSVFQDEFTAVKNHAESLKTSALASIDPQATIADDYEVKVKPVKIIALNQSETIEHPGTGEQIAIYDDGTWPKIKFGGYLIQKYEVNKDESTTFMGYLFSDNVENLYIVDKNVRYGASYVYKVRTVCEIDVKVTAMPQSGDASLSYPAVAKILVASEGKTTSTFCIENIPPDPPQSLRVGFNFRKKLPYLTWQFPLNKQRDIKRFQIFKRLSVEDPFVLIGEYDFDNSAVRGGVTEVAISKNLYRVPSPRVNFLDLSYKLGEKPIYTLASVDAHGMSSNYGAQIQMHYDKRRNKVITALISSPGAPKPYPNLYLQADAFQDAIKISGYKRMRVFFDPEYYKVFKYANIEDDQQEETSLKFIRANPNKDTYTMHIINLDLQKEEKVNIRIKDASGAPLSNSAVSYSEETHMLS